MDEEFLLPTELKRLTACGWRARQIDWLRSQCIPFKNEGDRIIVSRSHVRDWLEGRSNAPRRGMNLAAIR